MNTRRTRTMLWLTTAGLLAGSAAAIALHLIPPEVPPPPPPEAASPDTDSAELSDSDLYKKQAGVTLSPDAATLQTAAARNIRQRLFDPPVVAPKPPPPKPLPPVQLVSTILRSDGSAAAWVRDGQTTRMVRAGDTLGPEDNPATVQTIEADRLVLRHEGNDVELAQTTGRR